MQLSIVQYPMTGGWKRHVYGHPEAVSRYIAYDDRVVFRDMESYLGKIMQRGVWIGTGTECRLYRQMVAKDSDTKVLIYLCSRSKDGLRQLISRYDGFSQFYMDITYFEREYGDMGFITGNAYHIDASVYPDGGGEDADV